MDRIYTAQPYWRMPPEMVRQVCEIRLELDDFDKTPIYSDVTQCLIDQIPDSGAPVALDFGCGDGRFARLLRTERPLVSIVGCDISLRSLLLAKQTGLDVVHTSSAGPLPFASRAFDVIVASFVFHFDVPLEILVEFERICHLDGKVVVSTYGPGSQNLRSKCRVSGWSVIETRPTLHAGHEVLVLRHNPQ